MITDAQFQAWLSSEETVKTILAEVVYLEVVPPGSEEPGVLGVELLSTHAYVSEPTDDPASTPYRAWIKSIPAFVQSMSEVMVGRTTANLGEVVIAATEDTDSWLFSRDWIGRALRLYVGDVSWPKSDFRPVWSGVVADLRANGTNELVFVARDMQHLLNQPIRVPTFELGPSMGLPLPLVHGTVYNVPATLVDAVTHTYQINDGPIAALSQVRVAGIVTAPAMTGLFAGTFTMTSSTPSGLVTADVVGASVEGSSLDNASDLIRYLVTSRGYYLDADLDVDSFNELKALCPQKLGYFVPPADVKVYEAIDEIVNTVGAFYSITRDGKLFVKRFDLDGDPVMTITESDIVERGLQLLRVLQPVDEIRIGAKKNNQKVVNLVGGFGGATEERINQSHIRYHAMGGASNPEAGTYAKTRRIKPPEPVDNGDADDEGVLPSLFVSAADAAAEASRRMAIWGVRRYVFRLKCFIAPLRLRLGDVVTISHPRYNFVTAAFPNGRNATVIRISERLSQKQVELDVIL